MLNFLFAALLLAGIECANADDFDLASKMAQAGAEELALSYMQLHPPAKPDPQWSSLAIRLLSKFGKNQQVLETADKLPFSRETANYAIRAAFDLGKPAIARQWLAKLIWQGSPSKTALRQARLDVIRSYLAEKDGKNGYYAMLRFNQDYHPVRGVEAHEFVSGLVSAGMAKDAVAWLILLEDGDSAKIMAELETGLIGPDDAIKASKGDPEILLDAAKMKNDASLEIEAEEKLLAAEKIAGETLWKSYLDHAVGFSNRYGLLQGNYASWLDPISKIPDPYTQRSLLAYLSVKAPKSQAIPAILNSLKNEPKVATALFSKFKGLSDDERTVLGKMACDAGDYTGCTHYWEGLTLQKEDLPDLSIALLKTGQPGNAAASLLQYLQGIKALDQKAQDRLLPLACELAETKVRQADEILSSLLPLVDLSGQRKVLMQLGKISTDPKTAASYYFQASILSGKADEFSKKARLASIASLKQAGFTDDAKALEK